MKQIMQDLHFGLRMLIKTPGLTLTAVIALALGIGANTAIFSVIDFVLLRPLPYPHPEKLVSILEHDSDGPKTTVGFTTVDDWRSQNRSFERIVAVRGWGPTLTGEGNPERLSGMRVGHGFFEMLGVTPAYGRLFREQEDRPEAWRTVIISHSLWQRRFGGKPEVIGRPITLSGNPYIIAGVMSPEFDDQISANVFERADIWAPLGYERTLPEACRTCRHLRAFGRIRQDVSFEQAAAEIRSISANLKADNPGEYSTGVASIRRLQESIVGDVRSSLLLLMGVVGLILMIACANVANLLMVRSAGRRKEMAIRTAVGASRYRIFRQVLVESLVLSLAGGFAGLLVGLWGVDILPRISAGSIPGIERIRMDATVMLFNFVVCLITGLFFGVFPAWQASKTDPNAALKTEGPGRGGGARQRLLGTLVVGQIAVAMILILTGALFIRSFLRLAGVDAGFQPENLLTMSVSAFGPQYDDEAAVFNFHRKIIQEVESIPGIDSAAFTTNLPMSGNFDRAGFHIEGRPLANPADAPSPQRYGITTGYLRLMGIPLLRGRDFNDLDRPGSELVVLVNETLAGQLFPGEDPVGRHVRIGGNTSRIRKIVGVVGDVRHLSLDERIEPQVYVPHQQWTGSFVSLVVRTRSNPSENLIDSIRQKIWSIDQDQPVYDIALLTDLVAESFGRQQFIMQLATAMALLGLILATTGVYGLISWSVSQRSDEIAIRLALGATPRQVLRRVLIEGGRLILAGLSLGLLISLMIRDLLNGFLYEVTVDDPPTVAMVIAVLITVSLAACYMPARRAAGADPMATLRHQ
ncbi:MAG: ABC transporter permease [Acidobacteriota bacterium]|nr:MAG: ABC transporter permease [Acidobacteriota bacterium]